MAHLRDGNASARLIAARRRAGLSAADVATQLGPELASYRDLESDPNELFMNTALAHLQVLGGILGMDPLELLIGQSRPELGPDISFSDLQARLQAHHEHTQKSVEELSQAAGWDLKELMIDSDELWNFNVDGLVGLCQMLSVDWRRVLPGPA